ncbi:hypothetical protein PMI02_01154 [Novosphingobium sp. AP12]|nr:hypothetical protein PMI02_01154 [Novosphingobium sp. AP12]
MTTAWVTEGHAAYWKPYGNDALEATRLNIGNVLLFRASYSVPAYAAALIPALAKPRFPSRTAVTIK